jgi:hypothetical protein
MNMSFEKHTVKELKEVAEFYGVDLAEVKGKAAIIAEIQTDGVDYADAVKQVLAPDEPENDSVVETPVVAPAAVPAGPTLVVRMTRQNARYDAEANGRLYTFTREHPYAAMPDADAEVITDREEGFRIASPSEVREFYG